MRLALLFLIIQAFVGCQEGTDMGPEKYFALMEIPKGFPPMPEPQENTYSPERWQLGKKLFYDPVMSADSSISCGSCHKPALAFSDNVAFSPGVEARPGTRNSPTLVNVGYHPYFTREGGVPTLEMQILVPIQEHNEFASNIVLLAEKLNRDTAYIRMAQEAYGRDPDPFVITRALACFERSLISGYSRYDQFEFYQVKNALNRSEQRGMDLFFSEKTACSSCHGGFNFSNYAFENNGLYAEYPDTGRMRLTGDEEDRSLFKVPSLRNIALTGPYMHDGSLSSLEEVIDHYNNGGKANPQKSDMIRPLNLNQKEREDLVAFLRALTDEDFVSNPFFQKE